MTKGAEKLLKKLKRFYKQKKRHKESEESSRTMGSLQVIQKSFMPKYSDTDVGMYLRCLEREGYITSLKGFYVVWLTDKTIERIEQSFFKRAIKRVPIMDLLRTLLGNI